MRPFHIQGAGLSVDCPGAPYKGRLFHYTHYTTSRARCQEGILKIKKFFYFFDFY